jgi:hypothetical protein
MVSRDWNIRGYDSAGLAVDGDKKNEVFAFKEVGKVAKVEATHRGREARLSPRSSTRMQVSRTPDGRPTVHHLVSTAILTGKLVCTS